MSGNTPLEVIQAREIVKATLKPESHRRCHCREEIDAGEWDHRHTMRATVAALKATQEGVSHGG